MADETFLVPPIERRRLPLVARRTGTWEEHPQEKQPFDQREPAKKQERQEPDKLKEKRQEAEKLLEKITHTEHKIDCKI